MMFKNYFQIVIKAIDFSKWTISVSSFKFLFDSDPILVKDYLSKNPINNNHLRFNENLIKTPNNDVPIHINVDAGNP